MDLMNMLPRNQYRQEKHVEDFQSAVGKALGRLYDDYKDLFNQLRVSTSTWGLRHWERAYGIETDYSKPDDLRRSRVIAKMRGAQTTTVQRLKRVIESFLTPDIPVEVEEIFSKYIVSVTISELPAGRDLSGDIHEAVRDVIPAHLGLWLETQTPLSCPVYFTGAAPLSYAQTVLPEYKLTYDFRANEEIKAAAANIAYTVMPPLAANREG